MKKFGIIWNEVVQSWRNEDIISYAEQEKLEFNELPHIVLESEKLADLVRVKKVCYCDCKLSGFSS